MKIGITLDPYGAKHARYGKDVFAKLRSQGYRAVDFNLQNTDTEIYSSSEEDLCRKLREIKARAEEAGIIFSQVHGPWRYPPMDSTDDERAERMQKCRRSLLATSLLECKFWVIHPLMPYGTQDISTDKENETWETNVRFMKELAAYAEELGITVCIENMPMLNFSIATPERILDLVKAVNKENFMACLDTGHINVFGCLSLTDEIRRLGSYLKVVHIHDNLGDKDAHLFPKEGSIDWQGAVSALREIGFGGVFSLETAPSAALDDESFDKEAKRLFEIAKELTDQ